MVSAHLDIYVIILREKYTHPFFMKMKKITARIRILRQSYLNYCHYLPIKSSPSWS